MMSSIITGRVAVVTIILSVETAGKSLPLEGKAFSFEFAQLEGAAGGEDTALIVHRGFDDGYRPPAFEHLALGAKP